MADAGDGTRRGGARRRLPHHGVAQERLLVALLALAGCGRAELPKRPVLGTQAGEAQAARERCMIRASNGLPCQPEQDYDPRTDARLPHAN